MQCLNYPEEDEMDGLYSNADTQEKEEPPLSKEVADELKKQVAAEKGKGEQVELQATSTGRVLRHSCIVGLQLMINNRWLSCRGGHCNSETCPGLFFEGHDIYPCRGEVFRVYRAAGPGNILNGDFIGIYYPSQNTWFSMLSGKGHKSTCPGNPHNGFGFQDFSRWFRCSGEVFQVYVKGKKLGTPITDQDTLSIYYPAGISNVVFKSNENVLDRCMLDLSSFTRPPTNKAFDSCKEMSVEITILD